MKAPRTVVPIFIASALASAAVALAAGCSLDWDLPALGASGDGSADDGVSSNLTDAGVGPAADTSVVEITPTGPKCAASDMCDAGERCLFADQGKCGGSEGACVRLVTSGCQATGTDAAVPQFCECGGKLAANGCELAKTMASLALGCAPDVTHFSCGYIECPRNTHFCEKFADGHDECKPFLAVKGCEGTHTCACVAQNDCKGTCANGAIVGGSGAVTVMCP